MPVSPDNLHTAARHLARSERGRQALADLRTLLDNGADALDAANKHALLTLIGAACAGRPASTTDAITLALELSPPPLWLEDDTDQPPPRAPHIV